MHEIWYLHSKSNNLAIILLFSARCCLQFIGMYASYSHHYWLCIAWITKLSLTVFCVLHFFHLITLHTIKYVVVGCCSCHIVKHEHWLDTHSSFKKHIRKKIWSFFFGCCLLFWTLNDVEKMPLWTSNSRFG